MRIFIVSIILLYSNFVFAQDCESVIALSKVQSVVISDENTVNEHAAKFCDEYSKSSGSSSSTNIGASYKFLSATFGSSGASTDQVASKYCSANNSYQASKDAYRQYVESISPNAFGAYTQCVSMSRLSVRYNIDVASILPNEFTMSVQFSSNAVGDKSANLSYSSPEGIQCTWGNSEDRSVDIPSGSTEIIKCSRQDSSKRSYVTVFRRNGDGTPMTLSWPAYNDAGLPIDTLAALQHNLNEMSSATSELKAALETLRIQNDALKIDLVAQISKRKMTWAKSGETCPDGSQTLGTIGVIMANAHYAQNIGQGGAFNNGWTWTHPSLCWFP